MLTPLTIPAYAPCEHRHWNWANRPPDLHAGIFIISAYCAYCGLPAPTHQRYQEARNRAVYDAGHSKGFFSVMHDIREWPEQNSDDAMPDVPNDPYYGFVTLGDRE